MSKPTKQVVLVTTVKTAGKIVANRFVSFAGKQATATDKVLGATPYDADINEILAVDTIGTVVVEAGGALAVGDEVSPDAQGCAVKTAGSAKAVGIARSAAAGAGELIQVLVRG